MAVVWSGDCSSARTITGVFGRCRQRDHDAITALVFGRVQNAIRAGGPIAVDHGGGRFVTMQDHNRCRVIIGQIEQRLTGRLDRARRHHFFGHQQRRNACFTILPCQVDTALGDGVEPCLVGRRQLRNVIAGLQLAARGHVKRMTDDGRTPRQITEHGMAVTGLAAQSSGQIDCRGDRPGRSEYFGRRDIGDTLFNRRDLPPVISVEPHAKGFGLQPGVEPVDKTIC